MRHFLAAVVALSLSACAAPDVVDVGYVSGSDEGYAQALEAARMWNETCGATLVVVHRGEGDVEMREQGGTVHGGFGETKIERPVLGAIGEKRPTEIRFMSGWQAPVTLAHEFGHALGLGHSDHGIMQSGVYWEHLNPATQYRTILPGLISIDDCNAVR